MLPPRLKTKATQRLPKALDKAVVRTMPGRARVAPRRKSLTESTEVRETPALFR